MPIFYIPIVFYLIYLAIRFRGLSFLSCNPGMRLSGLYGENKASLLSNLSLAAPDCIPVFITFEASQTAEDRINLAYQFIQERKLEYPLVLKPDAGQRGQGVAVVRTNSQLEEYLRTNKTKVLLQEHVAGEEFGVFYMRKPDSKQGFIYSITEKTFPVLLGDGQSTLLELLMSNSRTHYMANYLLDLHSDQLDRVLAQGEQFKVVEIGSHCRGSVFLEASEYISDELTTAIDHIAQAIDGYYFGRFDIRVPNKDDLKQGVNIKVIEFNGVTSESTNCYDPSYSVIDAYKILFKQWQWAFEIGHANIQNGISEHGLKDLVKEVRSQRAISA